MKPSSHDSDELDLLLNRLADDALTADEVHRLTEHLRGSAQARQRYRHFMALHSALGWDYAAAARTVPVAALAPAQKMAMQQFLSQVGGGLRGKLDERLVALR